MIFVNGVLSKNCAAFVLLSFLTQLIRVIRVIRSLKIGCGYTAALRCFVVSKTKQQSQYSGVHPRPSVV